jgi:Na+-translocating ferredoxin:NAD+ oxidoreductase RnfC subunit
LKAAIARLYNQHDSPEKQFLTDCHTHNILALVRLAGLETVRASDVAKNSALAQSWLIVKDWNERSRYERHSHAKASKMIDAVADNVNGVLPWIEVHW